MYKSHGDVEMKTTSSVRFSHITLGSGFCFKREMGEFGFVLATPFENIFNF